MALEFEYCECGCKGWAASAGDHIHYWISDKGDTSGRKGYVLHRGHGWMAPVIESGLPSYKAAVEAARKDAQAELAKIVRDIGG